jgi:hypothetical protein
MVRSSSAKVGNGNEWRIIAKRGHGFDQHLIAKAKFREVQIDDGKALLW